MSLKNCLSGPHSANFSKKEKAEIIATSNRLFLAGATRAEADRQAVQQLIDKTLSDMVVTEKPATYNKNGSLSKNAITGDLSKVNPAVRAAVEARLSRLSKSEQARIRKNLKDNVSTAWAAVTIKGMAYREMLERAMDGKDISDLEKNDIWGEKDMSVTRLIKDFKKYPQYGDKILKALLNQYDFIGNNRKAEKDISTSFANCDPSKACAIHCYAAGVNARPDEIAKSELTELMLERFPEEMADKIFNDYSFSQAGIAGLSLRLNDKGDLSEAQVTLVENLNSRGMALQIFSKRPALLRKLSDLNLKMLSIDHTNIDIAEANPDMRLAVTITDEMTEEMLIPLHDRVAVYMPVNLKGRAVTREGLKERFPNLFHKMVKENLCPVDSGAVRVKPGTSFVSIKDKTAEKGLWTCTACDFLGAAGCFHGNRKTNERRASIVMASDLQRDLALLRVRKELQSNLDQLLSLGGITNEQHKQLSQELSSGQRTVRAYVVGEATQGSPEGAGGTDQGVKESGSGSERYASGNVQAAGRVTEYETDLFGAPIAKPAEAKPRKPRVSGNVDAAETIFSDGSKGSFATRTKLVTEGFRDIGLAKVKTIEDAAQAMAYLGRHAVERFDALVTDKNGKPLAIVGSFKGTINQTSVYPATLTGEAFRIKGAAHIWFAHNHPSGTPVLSGADRNMVKALNTAFRGSEIQPHGLFAIGGSADGQRAWNHTNDGSDTSAGYAESTQQKRKMVPIVERVIDKSGHIGDAIGSPLQAKSIARNVSNGESGIMLLDSQNVPVAFVPVSAMDAMPLREQGRMDALYRAVSLSNAGAGIIVNHNDYTKDQARNLAGFLNSLDVRTLDVMDVNPGGQIDSWAETGKDTETKVFYSRAQPFYSQLSKVMAAAPEKLFTSGNALKAWLAANAAKHGIKKDEIVWSGIEEYLTLRGKEKVTRSEVNDFLAQNGVQVDEVVYGENSEARQKFIDDYIEQRRQEYIEEKNQNIDNELERIEPQYWVNEIEGEDGEQLWEIRTDYGSDNETYGDYEEALSRADDYNDDVMREAQRDIENDYPVFDEEDALNDAEKDWEYESGSSTNTQYETYVPPGGIDGTYRETLVTLPAKIDTPKTLTELPEGYEVGMDSSQLGDKYYITPPGQTHAKPMNLFGRLYYPTANEAKGSAISYLNNEAHWAAKNSPKNYKSGHWYGVPNVAVHVRTDEIAGPDGNRALRVIEIQSDWGQEGKKQGFDQRNGERITELRRRMKEAEQDIDNNISLEEMRGTEVTMLSAKIAKMKADPRTPQSEIDSALEAKIEAVYKRRLAREAAQEAQLTLRVSQHELSRLESMSVVPSAPFVADTKAWVALGIKRAIIRAVSSGLNRVVFATGQQNIDNYPTLVDLVNNIDVVGRTDAYTGEKTRSVTLNVKDGSPIQLGINADGVVDNTAKAELKGKRLDDIIGKEMADKIMSGAVPSSYADLDLKVGGEGMRAFYDKIVPSVAGELAKKLGGKIVRVPIKQEQRAMAATNGVDWGVSFNGIGYVDKVRFKTQAEAQEAARAYNEQRQEYTTAIEITQAMRDKVMGEGLPLFTRGQQQGKTAAQHVAWVEGEVAKVKQGWKNAPKIIVAKNMADPKIPDAVRSHNDTMLSQGAEGEPVAFIFGGDVYVIAGQMNTVDDIATAVFHEALGHAGLNGVFGETLKPILRQIINIRSKDVAAKAKEYGLDVTKEEDRLIAAEEVLAEMAEKNPQSGFVKRAIAAIRKFLRDLGLKLNLSDNDILHNYLLPARAFIQNGGKPVDWHQAIEQNRGTESAYSRVDNQGEENGQANALRPGSQADENTDRTVGGTPRVGWTETTRISRKDGKPATAARGAGAALAPEHFSKEALGKASGNPSSGLGVWFALTQKEDVTKYGDVIEGFHLDIRNPKVYTSDTFPSFDSVDEAFALREKLRKQGYDGIMVNYQDVGGPVHVVAFEPEQAIYPGKAKFQRETENVPMWELVDRHTGAVVGGPYKSRSKARQWQDKRDNEYGGYRYAVREIKTSIDTPKYQRVDHTKSAGFQKWSGGAEVVPLGAPHEYVSGEPVVVEAVHGTASDFTEFDTNRANTESDLGAGIYATNTIEDASNNYAGEGPDLTSRIEMLKEQYEQSLEDDEWSEGKTDDEIKAEAERRARNDLAVTHGGMAMPVFVRFNNPVVMGSDGETFLDYSESYDEETEEYGEPEGKLVEFIDALRNSPYEDTDMEAFIGEIFDAAIDNEGIKASTLHNLFKTSNNVMYAYGKNGALVNNEIMRRAFEGIGFDGIIDTTVNDKFGRRAGVYGKAIEGMKGVNPETVHFVAFKPTQIKSSVGNNGEFDTVNPDIRYSRRQQQIPGATMPTPPQMTVQNPLPMQPGVNGNRASWDSPEQTGFDDVVYKLQDKHIDMKRVIANITKSAGQIADKWNTYLQEELFHGRTAKRTTDFVDLELNPVLHDAAAAGLTIDDIDEYLHARHAEEANDLIAQRDPNFTGPGSGMETAEAKKYLAALPARRRLDLEAIAGKIDDIIARTRQLYVGYGLESQDTVDEWADMFKHYVPLMREDHDHGMGVGQGFSIKGKEVKHRTGSTAPVIDILANIAMQREKVIVRGEKNRVAVSLAGLVKMNPNPDFWTFDTVPAERVLNEKTGLIETRVDPMFRQRDNVVIAKIKNRKGEVEERAIVFNEHNQRAIRMAMALKNMDAARLEGLMGKLAIVSRYFSAINTQWNPVFGFVNITRDVQGALINLRSTQLSGKKTEVLGNTWSALFGVFNDARLERKGKTGTSKWAHLWEEFQDEGGQTGYRDLFANSNDRARKIKHALDPNAWMDSPLGKVFTANGTLRVPMAKAQDLAGWIFDLLSDFNLAMENAVRLASYKVGKDNGMTKQQAASLAKNLTVNFNRKGQASQQAGALYAFFNASMQGTARMGETLIDMKDGDIRTLRLNSVGKSVVTGGVLLGVMQAVMMAAAGFGDDEPPEFIRERNLIIPIGGENHNYLTVPMPLGFHVIPNIGRILTEIAMGRGDQTKGTGARVMDLFGILADAFNPVGGSGLDLQTISPTALDPFVALGTNKDWTGKPIAKEDFNSLSPTPGFTRTKDTASAWAKALSELINTTFGGTDYTPGYFSPTPDQIDYLAGQITGGVGRELSKAEQVATAAATGGEIPAYKIPLVGRYYGNTAGQAGQGGKYYANLKKLNIVEAEVKGRRKEHDPEVFDYMQEHPEYKLVSFANKTERRISDLKSLKRKMQDRGASDEAISRIDDQITHVMQQFNERVDAFEGAR